MAFNESHVAVLRESLSDLHTRISALADTNDHACTQNSIAASELATFKRPESITTAHSIADQLIEYSAEHLSAFVKTITEPIETLACWTCIRSMLESCAISAWLSDPAINAEQRVGRAFAMRYEGLSQQLKFGRCIGQPPAELERIKKHIIEVENIAIGLGYPRLQNKKGFRDGIGERMPLATDLIGSELDEESMYRLLSAVAHGHSWAISQIGFKPISASAAGVKTCGTHEHFMEKRVDPDGLAYLAIRGARAFARPLWSQYQYMGWDQISLEEILEDVFDQMQATTTVRFWRSS